jgi:uncharacterized membrane protein
MQNPPPNQPGYDYNKPSGAPPPNYAASTGPGATGGKTSMGLDANVAALLSYVLTWVTGLVFFLVEKENRFVRFHAMQSILFGASWFIIAILFMFISITLAMMDIGILSLLFWPIRLIFWLGFFAVWIMLLIKAYQGQMFKLPIIGKMAEGIVNK